MKHALKYIMVLLLTAGIFVASWYLSASINRHKFAALQAAQNKMSVDILSSETQFDLLKQNSCDDSGASVFADDLATLADKIAYSEQNFGSSDDIATLKQQYTLLEVRDFLLTKQVAERCHEPDPQTIFYFYGTKEGCPDCVKESYVLDALHQNNPYLRVYSFDYNLDLSTIKALRTIYGIGDTLPALVINGTTYSGFQSLERIVALLAKSPPSVSLSFPQ